MEYFKKVRHNTSERTVNTSFGTISCECKWWKRYYYLIKQFLEEKSLEIVVGLDSIFLVFVILAPAISDSIEKRDDCLLHPLINDIVVYGFLFLVILSFVINNWNLRKLIKK